MQRDTRISGKLQSTLEDMKRKLEKEREAAETLTRHLAVHRDQRAPLGESRIGKLEADLNSARQQILEQKGVTEQWIQQVSAERDAGRSRLRASEATIQKLNQDLLAAQQQMKEQRDAAEGMIPQ